jgi:hypothetical protein
MWAELHPLSQGRRGQPRAWFCLFCFEDLEVLFPSFVVPVTHQLYA